MTLIGLLDTDGWSDLRQSAVELRHQRAMPMAPVGAGVAPDAHPTLATFVTPPCRKSSLWRCRSPPLALLAQSRRRSRRRTTATTSPRCVGKHAREGYKEWLVEDARRHIADVQMSPALDCADLAEQLRMNADAAYANLARLDLVQLTLQAVCYAAYANELLGLDVSSDTVLAVGRAACERKGEAYRLVS